MKVSQINRNVPQRLVKHNNSNLNRNTYHSEQSFKGGLDSFALGVANFIENGGLAVSFIMQDMLGTILPRPIMGLKRNSSANKGKKNIKFAAKELTREIITGPSMFIIPAGMLAIGKKIFGKTINIPAKAIKALGDIHAKSSINGTIINKQEFYKDAFTQILKNAKSETEASEKTLSTAADFAKKLAENVKDKSEIKNTINEISNKFINISKKYASDPAHTDFTSAALSDTMHANIKDTISYITSYADDVVEKAKNQDSSKVTEFINKIVNRKVIGRFAMNIAMFAAVLGFLQVIPKIYNKVEGEGNSGLKGLMTEETLKDEPKKEEVKESKNKNVKQDKSKPSFGSSAGFADILTGTGLPAKIAGGMEFSGYNLSFPLLLGVMGLGILGPRIRNAKDKYDREEIMRRDFVTCTVMCFGEKELRKGFSKMNENKSGFVLAAKEQGFKNQNILKRFWDYIRPINGVKVMSSGQIISKYSNLEAYKEGIKGFCDFIEGQGGNLKKVFSLTDESKSLVESLLTKEGKSLAEADNATIKEILSKAKDSGAEEISKLTELFKDTNNPWVTKAKTLNARFTALSVLVLVPVFLGFMLPWINEKITKKKFAQENMAKDTKPIQNSKPIVDYKMPELFKDIANGAK